MRERGRRFKRKKERKVSFIIIHITKCLVKKNKKMLIIICFSWQKMFFFYYFYFFLNALNKVSSQYSSSVMFPEGYLKPCLMLGLLCFNQKKRKVFENVEKYIQTKNFNKKKAYIYMYIYITHNGSRSIWTMSFLYLILQNLLTYGVRKVCLVT